MPDFIIREAGLSDAERICSFIESLAEHEGVLDETAPSVERLRTDMQSIAHCRVRGLIADIPRVRSIGCCLWFPGYNPNTTRPTIELKSLFVEEASRKLGVAKAMIRKLQEYGEQEGYESVSLEVFGYNRLALGFYKELGFESEGLQRMHLSCSAR